MGKRYHIITFGCSMNKSDSERLAQVLEENGYQRSEALALADVVIINACSVRQSAIDRVYGKGFYLKKEKRRRGVVSVLTGCVLEKDRRSLSQYFDLIINIQDVNRLPEILSNFNKTKKLISEIPLKFSLEKLKKEGTLSPEEESYLEIMPKRENKAFALIPISTGCNRFCTYCCVPYTRGLQVDRKSEQIIKEVEQAVKQGAKEVILLGQTVNSYYDESSNVSFTDLLREIDKIEGDFWISFQSPYPTDFDDETIQTIKNSKKVIRYINLPLQSGSNVILRKMNRRYSVEQYLEIVRKMRKEIPEISLAADIIVGFPGETEEDFQETVRVMEEVKYDMAFIARYSPRPGTTAQKLFQDDIPEKEKIRREKVLTKILKRTSLENNKKLVGREFRVLIYQKKPNYFYGKNFFGRNVIVPLSENNLMGKFVRVKIKQAHPFVLRGELLDQ